MGLPLTKCVAQGNPSVIWQHQWLLFLRNETQQNGRRRLNRNGGLPKEVFSEHASQFESRQPWEVEPCIADNAAATRRFASASTVRCREANLVEPLNLFRKRVLSVATFAAPAWTINKAVAATYSLGDPIFAVSIVCDAVLMSRGQSMSNGTQRQLE